jgi:hypothetical protein
VPPWGWRDPFPLAFSLAHLAPRLGAGVCVLKHVLRPPTEIIGMTSVAVAGGGALGLSSRTLRSFVEPLLRLYCA